MKKKDRQKQLQILSSVKGIGAVTAKQILKVIGSIEKADPKKMVNKVEKEVGEHKAQLFWDNFDSLVEMWEHVTRDRTPGSNTKFSSKMARSIAEDYSKGKATVAEICEKHGISIQTFYNWQDTHFEFFDAIKKATRIRNRIRGDMAMNGLERLLEGYDYTEQQTEAEPDPQNPNGRGKIKKTVITKKHVPPNPTMIIFTATNQLKEDWKHVTAIEHIHEQEPPPDLSRLSEEEKLQLEKLLSKATSEK